MGWRELSSLDQLRVFVAVAESDSFNDGGRRLSITQPAVGKQVNWLVNHFGLRLVNVQRLRPALQARVAVAA